MPLFFQFCRFSRYNKECSLCRLERARPNMPDEKYKCFLSMLDFLCVPYHFVGFLQGFWAMIAQFLSLSM